MARDRSFHCELEKSKDKDESGNQVTTIKCHGELVGNNAGEIKEVVRPLILLGGRIIIDLGDVKHLDSAGLRSAGRPQDVRNQPGAMHP